MIVNANTIVQRAIEIRIKNGIMKDVKVSVESIVCAKNRYLKSIVDNSVIVCNEIVSITDSVSTNVISSVPANVTSNVSINFDNKKIRYKMNCYNLQMFMLVVILLFLITIICYHYTKHWSKLKKYCSIDNIKWRIMN